MNCTFLYLILYLGQNQLTYIQYGPNLYPFFSKSPMLQKFKNLFTLYKIIKSRGNRELISHSRKQLVDFIFCNNDLNRKSFLQAIIYWFNMLKGLDVIVWRLETFGFIYSPILDDEEKIRLNKYLQLQRVMLLSTLRTSLKISPYPGTFIQ